MKVATVTSEHQKCPVHGIAMEFAVTSMDEPTWTCDECEIDYNLTDLIQESDSSVTTSFVVLDD